ncbi:uncharacterized protein PG986_010515 [Apiospora aurea]|uniref:Uncharacterized protein n=1 Tax=Apiospora aurea TaxID=335848 RepID=A0ABR1Q348_9PEZI
MPPGQSRGYGLVVESSVAGSALRGRRTPRGLTADVLCISSHWSCRCILCGLIPPLRDALAKARLQGSGISSGDAEWVDATVSDFLEDVYAMPPGKGCAHSMVQECFVPLDLCSLILLCLPDPLPLQVGGGFRTFMLSSRSTKEFGERENSKVTCKPCCQKADPSHRGMKNGHHYIASHISCKHKKDAAYRKDQSKLLEDGNDGHDLETIETPSKKTGTSGSKKEEDDLVKSGSDEGRQGLR